VVTISPYGSWASPISAELLVEQTVNLADLVLDGDRLLWSEARPSEGGRVVLVSRRVGEGVTPHHSAGHRTGPEPAPPRDLIPPPFSARTLVHEYGGRCVAARGHSRVFSNHADQRLWRIDGDSGPVPITPEPREPRSERFADPVISNDGGWVVCVRERHRNGGADNDIVAVASDGTAIRELAAGHDFYAAPRLSSDGRQLAFVTWDQPAMPWDATQLWVGDFNAGALDGVRLVAGSPGESVTQPRWSPDGRLHYISDRSGWWNIYDEDGRPLAPMEAEFSGPDWGFGQSTFTFLDDGRLVATWTALGGGRFGVVANGRADPVELELTSFSSLVGVGSSVCAIAASPTQAAAVVAIDVDRGVVEVIRRSRTMPVSAEALSVPEAVEFPTANGFSAHALFYEPKSVDHAAPAGELPPLIVMSHGGPTANASSELNLKTQYWTTRGFAVADVDYGGSTGYGRAYRDRLQGQWGIVDLDDCVHAATWLAAQGRVDGNRMAIRGGSAGGYTTLCALTFRDVFAAGADFYGVADLEMLAADTHKFEARYLDGLVGPYPQAVDEYRRRSPIHYVDQINCPVIVFQGLEDAVVPPSQSEAIVEALRRNGLPVAYLTFPGEQHGFRRAETIVTVAQAELAFYGRVLGFVPAGESFSLVIENEDAIRPRGGSPAS